MARRDGVRKSSRLKIDGTKCARRVNADQRLAKAAEASLVGVAGAELACSNASAKTNDAAAVLARRLLDEFHERVFAPQVDLS
jgi:hypothetical protein